jgi:hypothetical protein
MKLNWEESGMKRRKAIKLKVESYRRKLIERKNAVRIMR